VLRRLLIIFSLLPLASCATNTASAVRPSIYVVRHLHTPAGAQDPDLTPEGKAAAVRLGILLQRDPPQAIYVSATKRAQQTAAPVAQRFGVTPRVYDPSNTPSLVAAALREEGTVLIVGHSNTVPDIIEQLGGTRPAALVHEDFGDIWRVLGPTRDTSHTKISE